MESILQGLTGLYAECQNRGAATMGALLTIMIEGAKFMDTLWTVERREYASLKDRVKDLERVIEPTDPHNPSTSPTVPVNSPSAADLNAAGADLGSNNGVAGAFASTYVSPNATNSTGIGAAGTAGLVNLATGDRQLVRAHEVTFNASGTVTTATVSAPIRLGSVTFPVAFSRPPKVQIQAANTNGGVLNVHANVYAGGNGYDIVADLGTLVSGSSYYFSVTVTPN